MSQQVTLSRRATLIRKNGLLSPENPSDVIDASFLSTADHYSGTTTDGTQTELFLDGVSEQLTLASNTVLGFIARIVGQKVGGSKTYHATIEGTIHRVVAVGTTAFIGSPVITVVSDNSSGWSSTVTADTTNGALAIKVTGASSDTVHWIADINFVLVS
jgi:hypothetical protein